jgi:hypothetical protein
VTYSYETGLTSAPVNWRAGAGNGRKVTGITIHHWGSSNGLDFDGIVRFLCSPRPSNPTSAHYVAQGRDGKGNISPRVACIVDPDDIAYACGSWAANLSQISIECRPECSPEDREVVAQLIAKLRDQYGPLPLVGHQHWVPDACPGSNWMAALPWLSTRADQIRAGAPTIAPTPTPTIPASVTAPPEDPMKLITAPGRPWAILRGSVFTLMPAGVPTADYVKLGLPTTPVVISAALFDALKGA